jgi:hypothetical protein
MSFVVGKGFAKTVVGMEIIFDDSIRALKESRYGTYK